MKRDPNGRFIKKNTIEFSIPSPVFLVKYFSLLFILLPWIYLAIYKLNIWKVCEETLFFLFGEPITCENGRTEKNPY